ncbi:hypothetical protein N7470_004241 [Penicillium chermesinum]|nr:hypothetical protein N7470_004241 [Penicillium chermesinum]
MAEYGELAAYGIGGVAGDFNGETKAKPTFSIDENSVKASSPIISLIILTEKRRKADIKPLEFIRVDKSAVAIPIDQVVVLDGHSTDGLHTCQYW